MHKMGKHANTNYHNSIKDLKEQADIATNELYNLYNNQKESDYLKRQQAVETIREIKSPISIPMLVTIARKPMPIELSADLHHGSTRLEEGIIRLTAIEGLGHFAKEGDTTSYDALLSIVNNEKSPLPLKRQAVRELLHSTKNPKELNSLKQEMKQILPSKLHFIITEKIDTPDDQMPEIEINHQDETESEHHHHYPPKIETH